MGLVPDARRTRLSTLTALSVVAAVALGASAAAGLPGHGQPAAPVAMAIDPAVLPPGSDEYPFFDATALFGDQAPAPASVDKAVPQATRSNTRVAVPPAIPPKTAKDPECLLDLGYGVWKIDVTAARALTMFAAVAYSRGRKVEKAARAFQKNMHIEGRTAPDPVKALERIRFKYGHPVPRQVYVDAVLAMYRPHALTCTTPQREMPWEPMLTNGLTYRAQEMLFAWWDAYGGRPIGGFSPEGITTGHIEHSAHYDGRAVDISFSLSDKLNRARGWLLAHWLVANADYYQIQTVIWDGLIWSNYKSEEGWREYHHPWGPTKSPTLNHLDHIHVDVVKGWSEDMPEDQKSEAEQAADAAEAGTLEGAKGTAEGAKGSADRNGDVTRHAPKADPHVGGSD